MKLLKKSSRTDFETDRLTMYRKVSVQFLKAIILKDANNLSCNNQSAVYNLYILIVNIAQLDLILANINLKK